MSIVSSAWLPSGRPIVTLNGVNAPARVLVEPPSKFGSNGSWALGHGVPLGPEVIWNSDSAGVADSFDQFVKLAWEW